jgi:predicted SAM-dependent methyltransferase
MNLQILKTIVQLWSAELIYKFRRKRAVKESEIRLNLGCGTDKILGYYNLDIDPSCKPDIIADVRNFHSLFEYESINEIRGIHILNYLTHNEAIIFFKECHQLLKKNGFLVLEGPDIRKILFKYMNDDPNAIFAIFASNENGPTHKMPYLHAWDSQILVDRLKGIGFSTVVSELPQTHGKQEHRDFRVIACK